MCGRAARPLRWRATAKALRRWSNGSALFGPILVALEATGGFETVVAAALAAERLPLAVVNPRLIREFARAAGQLAKTDSLDARIIALFAERMRPEPRPLPDEQTQALAELVARRRQIVEMMTAERNRRRYLTNRRLLKSIDRLLKVLQQELVRSGAGSRRHHPRHAGLARDARTC